MNLTGRVFIDAMKGPEHLAGQIRTALEWLKWEKIIPSGAKVFIKPNLTLGTHSPGVTVTPEYMNSLVSVLKDRTSSITIGESDGGYHSFPMEQAFESHGLYDLVRRYGISLVNLSKLPAEEVSGEVAGREVAVSLPSSLLHDYDVFITVPVPKVHAMTVVSLGFKNQWGCLPSAMRLRNHPQFAEKIILINRLLKPRLALFDGTYFLDNTGPMIGDPVRMNLLIASDDIGAGSLACCRIMNIDPWRVKHFRIAKSEGVFPAAINEVATNQPLEPFCTRTFQLNRTAIHYVCLSAFNSSALTKVLYDSRAGDFMHRVLYSIRKNQVVKTVLYGKTGYLALEGSRHGRSS